ncbi:interleukin-13 receptor subunit alpha-2-like isoform X2 [Rhinoraja longicauda]
MGLNIVAIFLPALILWPSGTPATITVDPPTDLQIIDPGHLGPLHIHWKAPLNLTSENICMVRYMLTYCNVDSTNCKRIITRQLKHTDGFNLNKGVIVKVRTLVKEHCENESDLHSEWMEMTYLPLMEDSKIKNLQCIVYNLEYMDCLWENGASSPNDIDYRLYYWHEELEQVMKCNNYIKNQGHTVGCHFYNDSLIEFSDFNICINGTSRLGPVMPAYYMFQLQDLIKPAAPYEINMTASKNGIYLEWKPPAGNIKTHCLEYEVNFSEENADWKSKVLPDETTSTFLNITAKPKFCVRLRAAVNMFCADDSFWSEWSSTLCLKDYPAEEEHTIIKLNLFRELILLTTLVSISLVLLVGVLVYWVRWKRSFSNKKVNMLLTEETKSINERNCRNC